MMYINKKGNVLTKHDYIIESNIDGEILLFRTLWNNSDDNMFIVSLNSDGDFISEASNNALEKTFGLKKSQIDGLKLEEILDKDTFKSVTDRYKECIKLNKPITYNESAYLDGVNESFWKTTILPIQDKENGTYKIFGVSHEFTKFKNIQKELKLANETLEKNVKDRTRELSIALEMMKKLSITDKLTGLYNRCKLDEVLESELKLLNRYNEEFGLIIIDIDLFKSINDNYGHIRGDKVLVEFANLLKSNVRETDYVGRWGGEEFLVVCPKSNLEGTKALSEHLRLKIENFKFSEIETLTASFGATVFKNEDTFESIVNRSDKALYKAKKNGRNSVAVVL